MNTLEEIAGVLKRLKSAVIFTHTHPDGDAVGSAMALHRALSMLGIASEVVSDTEISEKFRFLGGMEEIKRFPTLDAEGYICVDASDESRLGELSRTFLKGMRRGRTTINIDHHRSNKFFCRYNYVKECASNCQHIAEIIRLLGVTPDRRIGDYLMAGLVTDSGVFTHSDVDGDTFRAAAYAADAGADVKEISYLMYEKQSKARAGLYLETLSALRYFLGGRLAVSLVRAEALARFGLSRDDTDGFVDFALTIDEVEVSVSLLEVKGGSYKASFRSKGKADVSEVAAKFGGGGHTLASGCMFFGDIEEIYDKIGYAVYQQLGDE